MLVFKNATKNVTKNEVPTQQTSKDLNDELREYLKMGKINKYKTKHLDKSIEDDGDEMDDLMNDNANVKGCWSKNKTRID